MIQTFKNQFEFNTSPTTKMEDKIIVLVQKARNAFEAKSFCQQNNGALYHPDHSYSKVVGFAKKHNVNDFYVGLSDEKVENQFHFSNGSAFPKSFHHLWASGQPNNYIPAFSKMCESGGEDHVISRNGKLHDFKGDVKFPFMCELVHVKSDNSSSLQLCTACLIFVQIVNTEFDPYSLHTFFESMCKEHENFLQNLIGKICDPISTFFMEVINLLKNKYFVSNKVCNLFQSCNLTEETLPNDKCSACKFLINQVKLAVFEENESSTISKKMPSLQNVLPYFCQTFGFNCKSLNLLTVLRRFFINQFDESRQEMFCIAFQQCTNEDD